MEKNKKIRRWTEAEEKRLIANVQKHVLCLNDAFQITSQEVQRSKGAVANHWYTHTSVESGKTLFFTASGKHVAVNRKNGKGVPLSIPLYKKILSILGLSY